MDLTPGEYASMTGLSAKALRLYAERGILTPDSVDDVSGHRRYARAQLRHGMVVDALRRAKVPLLRLAETADGGGFDFAQRREEVELARRMEDFHLDVAERIAHSDPRDLVPVAVEMPALEWVGVSVDLDVPDDLDDRIDAFAGLAIETPRVYAAFAEALHDSGVPAAETCWTGVPDGGSGGPRLLMARPAPAGAVDATRVATHVLDATGHRASVSSGTLPARTEITFAARADARPDPDDLVAEAVSGHLHLLAFEALRRERSLVPVGAGPRIVVNGASPFAPDASTTPVHVFDVVPGR